MTKKVGILTGGGDAPGLNGVIESATKNLAAAGIEVYGVEDGFEGVFEGSFTALDAPYVEGIHQNAGTILGTSNKRGIDDPKEFIAKFKDLGLDGLIVAGGDGTFKALSAVSEQIKIIGIPKSIDNDLPGTELTFGHLSASSLIARSISTLKNSAHAHKRIMIVECMGRSAGWLALNGGLAGYADAILIPERELRLSELIYGLKEALSAGKRGLVLAVSEGVKIEGQNVVRKVVENAPETIRLGGVSALLAQSLEDEIGLEARNVILGHLQRSEPPEVFDRLLTLKLGCIAAKLIIENSWGYGLSYRNGDIEQVNLSSFYGEPRLVARDCRSISYAKSLGIFI